MRGSSNIETQLDFVRSKWGEDTWGRVLGILTRSAMLAAGGLGIADDDDEPVDKRIRATRKRLARGAAHRLRGPVRGERYVKWLGREVHKFLKHAEHVDRQWVYEGSPESGPASEENARQIQDIDDRLSDLAEGDWVSIRDWALETRPNLDALSAIEARDQANAWHDVMNLKVAGPILEGRSGPVLHQFDDGFTIQQLTTHKALRIEGDAMKHCVGGYWKGVRDGSILILSLRDPKNQPHATFEISLDDLEGIPRYDPNQWRYINQLKGINNAPVAPEHHGRLWEFLAAQERQKSRGFTIQELGEAVVVWPVDKKLEHVWPPIDQILKKLEAWIAKRQARNVPWKSGRFEGVIEPSKLGRKGVATEMPRYLSAEYQGLDVYSLSHKWARIEQEGFEARIKDSRKSVEIYLRVMQGAKATDHRKVFQNAKALWGVLIDLQAINKIASKEGADVELKSGEVGWTTDYNVDLHEITDQFELVMGL